MLEELKILTGSNANDLEYQLYLLMKGKDKTNLDFIFNKVTDERVERRIKELDNINVAESDIGQNRYIRYSLEDFITR